MTRNAPMTTTVITTTLAAMLMVGTPSSSHAQDALADTLPLPAATTERGAAAAATPSSAPAVTPPTVGAASSDTPSAPAPAQQPLPGVSPSASPAASSAQPVFTPAGTPGAPAADAAMIVPAPSGMPGSALALPGDITKSPNTPQIVNDAVSRLQKTDQINLDDMIRAQDAINRLDLLLEIEKRQTELKKIRDERNKPAAGSLLGSSIPSSALNLPAIRANMPPPVSGASSASPSPRPSGSWDKYTVRRIFGSDGRYMAIIMDSDKPQTVRAGDKLPDGSKVSSVNLTGVSLSKDGKSKTLTIPSDAYIVRENGSAKP
jgi:type IV pilus biogenesis protein PilP